MQSKFANNGTLSTEKKLIQRKYDCAKYGLTIEEAEKLREKSCEICGVEAKKMCIDHDHKEKEKSYRGVLCQQCNTRLGWLEKHCDVILEYKNKPSTKKGKK